MPNALELYSPHFPRLLLLIPLSPFLIPPCLLPCRQPVRRLSSSVITVRWVISPGCWWRRCISTLCCCRRSLAVAAVSGASLCWAGVRPGCMITYLIGHVWGNVYLVLKTFPKALSQHLLFFSLFQLKTANGNNYAIHKFGRLPDLTKAVNDIPRFFNTCPKVCTLGFKLYTWHILALYSMDVFWSCLTANFLSHIVCPSLLTWPPGSAPSNINNWYISAQSLNI